MATVTNRSAPSPSSRRKVESDILVTPAIATDTVESAGKNFANSNDDLPTFRNKVSVWRTHRSGDRDILQSHPRARPPWRLPHQYHARSAIKQPITPAAISPTC